MAHKKKAHSKHHEAKHEGHSGHKKVGMVEPMAHGKGGQHLKSMKDHKMKGK
jgi:hypothetical protein